MKEVLLECNFRGFKWWLVVIGLLAATVRFGFFSFLHHQYMQSGVTAWHGVHALSITRGYPFLFDSAMVYRLQALQAEQNRLVDPQELLDEGWNLRPDMRWHGSDVPGYSFLLAMFWRFFPAKYIFAQVFVIALDVLASVGIAIPARLLFGSLAGISAGFLYALFPINALFSLFASRDHFGTLGIVFSFLFLVLYVKKRRLAYLVLSGLVLGIFSWFRPFGVALPLFYGIGISPYAGLRRGAVSTTFMIGVLLATFLIPYSIINKIFYNRFFSSFPYIPLAQSLAEIPNPYGFQNSDEFCVQEAQRVLNREDISLMDVGDYWKQRVLFVVKSDPVFIGKVLFHRARVVPTMGYTPFLSMPRKHFGTWWNFIAIPIRWFLKTIMIWMAICFAFVWWGRGWRIALLALVPGVGYFLSVFLFRWPDPRYYYPWLISSLLLLGATLGILFEKVPLRICLRKK